MPNESISPNDESLLKKLRRKAEFCRYAHSRLKEKYKKYRDAKEVAITLLSVFSSLLIGLYYREILHREWVLVVIFILPSVIIVIQTLDNTIFHWTHKVAKHEAAVSIWGNWVRESDFIEKQICQYAPDVANEKVKNIQEKYAQCMNNTPQIPHEKFLEYKRDFKEYLLKSKKIDTMNLSDIEAEKRHDKR